jgi:type II secretory ATPase GspE/PulE/Tfp pilus assembly ATPase PilB-like protein
MEHLMPDLAVIYIQSGTFLSIIEFVVFLVFFFLWLALLNWVYFDAMAVEAKAIFWTGLVFGAGIVVTIVWLILPAKFNVIAIVLYPVAVGVTSLAYVRDRNTRVLSVDRVLTLQHTKGLLSGKDKKLISGEGFIFTTANNNEVPVPQAKTGEFFGYRAAYDILTDALWRRASNITLVQQPENYKVAYYIDGAHVEQPDMSKDQAEYLIRFLKQLSDLDINERRKPQKGKFRTSKDKKNTEWEVTTAGSTAGEQLKIRHVLKEHMERLPELGLTQDQYERLNKLCQLKQGLFIISGPPKSGITTTLYALLRNHDAFLNSINTLEKQPAAELPNITQNVFSLSDTGTTTYAKKLQAVIRMGPDIVGIADCEDAQTARVACAAAKDGKIVYVVIKADSVIQALGIWMKLVGDKNLVAETLLGISNQRLIRKLCNECKQAYAPDKELLRKFNLPAEKVKVLYRPGKVIYDKRGKPRTCESCQESGFVGITGVFETILINDELRESIRHAKSLSDFNTQFRRAKMLYLQEQALRKVIGGVTSVNEMIRVLSASKAKKARKG